MSGTFLFLQVTSVLVVDQTCVSIVFDLLFQAVFSDVHTLMYGLYSRFKITVVVLGIHNKVWVRMAANVYNQMSDYEALRDAVLTLKQEETG